MLIQVRPAACGLRYLSLVLFVGTNGEVRLRFATPDVHTCMQVQTDGVGGSQVLDVRRRAGVGVVQLPLIPRAPFCKHARKPTWDYLNISTSGHTNNAWTLFKPACP